MRYSRREFVGRVAGLPVALRCIGNAQAAASSSRWVLLGTDLGNGIYRAAWNPATGTLGAPELAIATARPSFLARHPTLPVVYAVNEENGAGAGVSGFNLDPARGALSLINEVGSGGDGPCFVSVDPTGQMAFAANYAGGSFAAFRLTNTGRLAQAIGVFRYNQGEHGPVADRQEAAHIHCATIAPGNSFVIACDLGDDVLLVFPIGPGRGDYVHVPQRAAARRGSGPRHVAFHPNGNWLYCIHELDCTIDIFDWHLEHGEPRLRMREGSTVSTLANGSTTAGNTGCEVVVSDDGRFVYACTRGEDTVSVYRVDQNGGYLTEMQRVHCGGKTPRYIGFDPSRRWLIACNQAAPGNVAVFSHDPATGRLGLKPHVFTAPTPMHALWV